MNAASRLADFERRLGAAAPKADIRALPEAARAVWEIAGKPEAALRELPNNRAFLAACLRRIEADDPPTL
ncbi:MAG: hypothetical protein LBR23_02270 [Spirochaetaceae bacterium]|jgi:hypothetical protein|nr:hypothetical protein [Spirochaetaceae bacterium]